MSEKENENVNSNEESPDKPEKIKDPRREAQGKKLAEISKQAKEKKMRERIEQEMLDKKVEGWDIPYGYVVGTLGLAVAAGALFYGYNKKEAKLSQQPQRHLDKFD